MANITEWEFTADVASQINEILGTRPDLPFSTARCETRKRGDPERRDLAIYDRESNRVALTGEVKLPDKPDGRSPFQESLVMDAHKKADKEGVAYFFTWNVNRCVLWKTFEQGKPITERYIEPFDVLSVPILDSDEILNPRTRAEINKFLVYFLERSAAILSGSEPMLLLPMDEKFIFIWESALDPLVIETLAAVHTDYESDRLFRMHLDKWMRDDQGWTLSKDDESIIRENLERAAKFSCYVMANKIIFYKALRRRFPKMKSFRIPNNIKTGVELRELFNQYFDHATKLSNDYETVFSEDYGDALPFLSDACVASWRALSAQTDPFDFTQINYEVIGQIFERLLSTTERHKFGQHYTRSELVDLINVFCIRNPETTILDPACGGGTFLVRAYERKKSLSNGKLPHQKLISQLYGLDISTYPVHLTTINLATRDLVERANYPMVARKDFFSVNPEDKVFHTPHGTGTRMAWLKIPKVDCIVGNPPYVRHEKINDYYGKLYKKHLHEQVAKDAPAADLSGRSDIHCFFFTHGATFMDNGGYMGLLTSSTWLDASYGFHLQKFLLDNFEIIGLIESSCEPWFVGARVTTVATILRKQAEPQKRDQNRVKFVSIKKPLADVVAYHGTEEDRRLTFENVRQRIEGLDHEEETEIWRIRIRAQEELRRLGSNSVEISDDEADGAELDDEEVEETFCCSQQLFESQKATDNSYTGYKWGIILRAPDIYFKLLNRCGQAFVPMGKLSKIKFGLKSGSDKFFFPHDITEEALRNNTDEQLREKYGLSGADIKKIHLIRAGDGSVHLIESKYLEPEIHGLIVECQDIDNDFPCHNIANTQQI
jgi:type I restriction-modification system DNA methylase subunit